jgi:hypothetical protein
MEMNAVLAILEPEVAAQPEADLCAVEPEVLVAALSTPGLSEEAASEIEARLAKTPKANRFAFRVLVGWGKEQTGPLTLEEAADLDDAVDGLRRCCFKAIAEMWVPGDRPPLIYVPEMGMWVRTSRDDTAAFIEDRLLVELEPYRFVSREDLLVHALRGHFKNLPRAIRFDLIDEFRKSLTHKARVLNFLSFDANPGLLREDQVSPSPDSRPDAEHAIEFLVFSKEHLVEAIGDVAYGPTILEVTTPSAAPQGGGTGYVYGYGFGPFTASGAPIPSDLQVGVGGVPATVLAYNSDGYGVEGPPLPLEAVAFTIPPGQVGSVDVSVTTSSGSTAAANAMTYQPVQQYPLPGSVLFQGVYDPNTSLYYFTDSNKIQVFSKAQRQWLSPISIPLPSGATFQRLWGIALSPDGTKMAVSDAAANAIYLLDPSNPSSIQTFLLKAPNPTGVTTSPNGIALSDSGNVYITASNSYGPTYQLGQMASAYFKLDTASGAVTSYMIGGPDDGYLRAEISSDGSRVFTDDRGTLFSIDTVTDGISYGPRNLLCCGGDDDLSLAGNQTQITATGFIFDSNFNLQSFLTANDREAQNVSYVYGVKYSPSGSLLFQPSTNGIDVFDGNLGTFRNRISLPFALSQSFDALVSDGTDNVLVAITGQTGNGGIAVIDLSSLPEPAPLSYQSDLQSTASHIPVPSMAIKSPPAPQNSSVVPVSISQRIRHVTRR